MLEEAAESQNRYQRFLKRVVETGVVWSLDNGRGVVNTSSNDDDQRVVLLFWSERAWALRCAAEDWSSYKPRQIPLNEFMDLWLPGMKSDAVLAGPEWNQHLIGLEIEPGTLLAELTEAMQK